MQDKWMTHHMHGVLLAIEVFWVVGVLAIFVFYFVVKRRVRARRRREAAEASVRQHGEPPRDKGPDSERPSK